jgi:hypothetical protein
MNTSMVAAKTPAAEAQPKADEIVDIDPKFANL